MHKLLASISGHQSPHSVLEVEGEASQSGQTEVGSQSFTVRQLPHPSAKNWASLKNTRIRIGQFRRVTYHAYIQGKVLFACPHAKQARRCHRGLAIAPYRHPGPFLLSPRANCTDVQPQDSAHRTTRYAPFKTPSHTSHNHSPCKLPRLVLATQIDKFSSRRFLQYSLSISTASNTMRLQAV